MQITKDPKSLLLQYNVWNKSGKDKILVSISAAKIRQHHSNSFCLLFSLQKYLHSQESRNRKAWWLFSSSGGLLHCPSCYQV